MAEDSWPKSTRNGGTITDYEHEQLVAPIQHSGLIGQPSDPTLVYADSTGLQFKVRALRYGMVRAKEWYSGPNETTKAIGPNTSGATRYDLVVLRWDRSTNAVTLEVRQGTPGQARPAPVQEAPPAKTFGTGIWELPIAQVAVANNAATIAAGDVSYLAWYIGPDGLILCTDTTRPYGATPYPGIEIYENNTGNKLRWTGTAWKRLEWDQAWGLIGGQIYQPGGNLCNGLTVSELPMIFSGPQNLKAGRKYEIRGAIRWTTPAAGNTMIECFIKENDTSGSPHGENTFYNGPGSAPQLAYLVAPFMPAADLNAKTFCMSARVVTGGPVDISRSAALTGPNMVRLEIFDVGPAKNEAV